MACAVAQVGKETFRIIRETVDDMISVSTDEICAGGKGYFLKIPGRLPSPAGALAVAGLKKYADAHNIVSARQWRATVSGANTRLRSTALYLRAD